MSDLTSNNLEPWQEAILRFGDQSHTIIMRPNGHGKSRLTALEAGRRLGRQSTNFIRNFLTELERGQ